MGENLWGHVQETWIWKDIDTGSASIYETSHASQLWSRDPSNEQRSCWVLLQWFGVLRRPGDGARQLDHVGRHRLRYV